MLRSGGHRSCCSRASGLSLTPSTATRRPSPEDGHGGHLVAPMPGSVVSVLVKVGDTVKKGQPLIIMEAMKMEHTIVAPFDGAVEAIYFAAKEQVKEGAELVALAEAKATRLAAARCATVRPGPRARVELRQPRDAASSCDRCASGAHFTWRCTAAFNAS